MANTKHSGRKQPFFVLGTARSGTSWCANLLSTHPQISAVTTAEHTQITGIHESHLFSHTRYCFPRNLTSRQFIQRYKEEDYFKLTGLSPQNFCEAHPGEYTVYALFRMLMDDFADLQGTDHWLEKTPKHTIYYHELMQQFPDAYIVLMRRGMQKTLTSNISTYPRKGASKAQQVIEKVFRYVSDKRAMRRLKKEFGERLIEVNYEALLNNTQQEIARVLRFLKLEVCDLHSPFQTNASARLAKGGQKPISSFGWTAIYILYALFWLVPFPVMQYLRRRRDMQSAIKFPKYNFVISPWQESQT